MISNSLEKALNNQIVCEIYSANLYLSMSFYLEKEGYTGFSTWMKKQTGWMQITATVLPVRLPPMSMMSISMLKPSQVKSIVVITDIWMNKLLPQVFQAVASTASEFLYLRWILW